MSTVNLSRVSCNCGQHAKKVVVSKEGSKFYGKAIWICAKGHPDKGGCGFFQEVLPDEVNKFAQTVVANSNSVPVFKTQHTNTVRASEGLKFEQEPAKVSPPAPFGGSAIEFDGDEAPPPSSFQSSANRPSNPSSTSSIPPSHAVGGSTTPPEGLVINCNCENAAQRCVTKRVGPNHNRVFYACRSPQSARCKFFKWEDEYLAELEAAKMSRLDGPAPSVDQGDPNRPPVSRRVVQHDALLRQFAAPDKDPITSCLTRNTSALAEFASIAKTRGYSCILQSEWDIISNYREIRLTKGPYNMEDFYLLIRPISSSPAPRAHGVWLQYHGTTPDDDGFVRKGSAQFIAFQLADRFIICNRRALWAYLDTQVVKEYVTDSTLAEKCLYRPMQHNEAITWVSVDDLEKFRLPAAKIDKVIIDVWYRDQSQLTSSVSSSINDTVKSEDAMDIS